MSKPFWANSDIRLPTQGEFPLAKRGILFFVKPDFGPPIPIYGAKDRNGKLWRALNGIPSAGYDSVMPWESEEGERMYLGFESAVQAISPWVEYVYNPYVLVHFNGGDGKGEWLRLHKVRDESVRAAAEIANLDLIERIEALEGRIDALQDRVEKIAIFISKKAGLIESL